MISSGRGWKNDELQEHGKDGNDKTKYQNTRNKFQDQYIAKGWDVTER